MFERFAIKPHCCPICSRVIDVLRDVGGGAPFASADQRVVVPCAGCDTLLILFGDGRCREMTDAELRAAIAERPELAAELRITLEMRQASRFIEAHTRAMNN